MLDSLRRGANSFIAKILFMLLVFAFMVWGIPRTFLNFQDAALVHVGSTRISPEQFQREVRFEMKTLSDRAGRPITRDEARAYGIDSQALTRLVGSAAADADVRELGLLPGPNTIVQDLKRDATFSGLDGKFSRETFDRFLSQTGMSESEFIAEKARLDGRRMVLGTLSEAVVTPRAMLDLLHAYQGEQRGIEHFTIDPAKVASPPEPDEAQLKAAYEASKRQYMTAETRALDVLVMTADAVKGQVSLTPDEVAAAYENDKARYDVPEKRHVLQIAFKDKAAAEAARAAIAGGKSFADAAKDAGAMASDTDLGVVTKSQLFDPAIRDAAFALPQDGLSQVVSGRVATVLLKVTEIQPGKTTTLKDVEPEIRERLMKEKAQLEVQKLREGVEDSRSAQKSLKEIADGLKLPFYAIASTTRDGKAPDGKAALDLPFADPIIAAGYEAQPGADHDAIDLPEGGFAWVTVKSVTAPKQKPFEEVRADVKAAVDAANRARAIADFAGKLTDRANAGEAMGALAQEAGGPVATALSVTRATLPQGLTKAAVTQAFALAKDKAGSSMSVDGKSRCLFKVIDIKEAPAATKEEMLAYQKELKRQIDSEIANAYVSALEAKYGVKVNTEMLSRLTGTGAQQ